MEGTILIAFYGIISLLLVVGGVYSIWAGQSLFRQGVGLKREGSSFEAENKAFKIKATASSVGGTLMLTAWLWGYFAMQNLPAFEDKKSGITISSLADEGISFDVLAAAEIEPMELASLDPAQLGSAEFEQRIANARSDLREEAQRIASLEATAVAADELRDDNQALQDRVRALEEENARLRSGPKDSCGEILFRFDRDNVCEAIADEVAETLGAVIDSNPASIEVNGYTDPVGSETYNLDLGQRRADSVAGLLVDLGMPRDKISVTSFGERFSEDLGEEDHWRMRKVIIKVKR